MSSIDLSTIDPQTLAALYSAFRDQQSAERDAAKIAREQARAAREALHAEIGADLTSAVETLLCFVPAEPAEREGSAWVGASASTIPVTVDGVEYAVTLSVKDVSATAARKAALPA